MLTNKEFFNSLSENYDNMISFSKAVEKKKDFLKEFINNDVQQSAADLGCGTGVDSIALSKLGFDVTAFDISEGMIKKAKLNAEKENAKINFTNKSITEIPEDNFNKYDLVISLGNSLANLNKKEFEDAVKIIKSMLRENGSVLIQILNYTPVLKNKERIINITRDDNFHFVRFYDFENEWLRFNILKYSVSNPKDFEIISTKIFPHEFNFIKKLFEENGFKNVNLFGGLNKNPFDKNTSKDLVIFAEA